MKLEMPDKNANLETPDGRKYRQKDGVVELPDKDARAFLDSGAPVRVYRKLWGGVDIRELEERAKRWKEEHGHETEA